MAEFHFVEDHEKRVATLMRDHPIDEAISLTVGGAYNIIGRIEAEALIMNGLSDGMRLQLGGFSILDRYLVNPERSRRLPTDWPAAKIARSGIRADRMFWPTPPTMFDRTFPHVRQRRLG